MLRSDVTDCDIAVVEIKVQVTRNKIGSALFTGDELSVLKFLIVGQLCVQKKTDVQHRFFYLELDYYLPPNTYRTFIPNPSALKSVSSTM